MTKLMTARVAVMLSTAACVMALMSTVTATLSTARAGDGKQLEGSWVVTTTIPGDPNSPFKSLATINGDGTFVESLQPGLNPLVSDVHGVWTRTGKRDFATTGVYLRSDGAGNFVGTTKVLAILTLSKTLDEGSARFQADLFDPAGNPVGSFTGTSQISRIKVEQLD